PRPPRVRRHPRPHRQRRPRAVLHPSARARGLAAARPPPRPRRLGPGPARLRVDLTPRRAPARVRGGGGSTRRRPGRRGLQRAPRAGRPPRGRRPPRRGGAPPERVVVLLRGADDRTAPHRLTGTPIDPWSRGPGAGRFAAGGRHATPETSRATSERL